MEHELKCWPPYFQALIIGIKTFELRKDDRNFNVGDVLRLREWNPRTEQYSGREARRAVTYKLPHLEGAGCAADFGLKDGYVILGVSPTIKATER